MTDGLGPLPETADFEGWANVAGFGERDASGKFWFYRNGGDGMWDAYCAGAGDQRGRDAVAMRDHIGQTVVDAVTAERERLAAEFTKRAEALNTTGTGCAPHIQAQYEAMAGELLDWAAILRA
jgi:hypothetical protein